MSVNIQSSFTVYTAALHALILNPLLLAYFWLGLSWIDSIDSISANKRFSSSKTSSRKPYSNSKQQEKQNHSAENTINFSSVVNCASAGTLPAEAESLRPLRGRLNKSGSRRITARSSLEYAHHTVLLPPLYSNVQSIQMGL